jgi:hypothetical protein
VRHQPITSEILWVPQVDHARIGKSSSIPLIPRIKSEFDCPDGIDAQSGAAIFGEDVCAYPTGTRMAGRSGRGENEHEAQGPHILIEQVLELANRVQICQLHAWWRALMEER